MVSIGSLYKRLCFLLVRWFFFFFYGNFGDFFDNFLILYSLLAFLLS